MADETATKKKLGPVSRSERARYRARLANDADRGRPETATAEKLCSVLGVDPLSLRVPRENDAGRVAGQAFVVALDTIISLGDRGKRLTRNTLFDALARYWSIRYRRARLRGARISYDMQRSTFRQASRELLMAGVNEEALWDLLVSQVEVVAKQRVSPHPGLAQLYTLRRASGRGHAGGASSSYVMVRSSMRSGTRSCETRSTGALCTGDYCSRTSTRARCRRATRRVRSARTTRCRPARGPAR